MPKRKTSTALTRIMTYGCLPPTAGAAEFSEQLLLAHRYRNKLIEIERAKRARFREIRASHAPRLAEVEKAVETLTLTIDKLHELSRQRGYLIKELKQATGKRAERLRLRLVEAEAAKLQMDGLSAERKLLNAEAKAERKAFKELLEPARLAYKARSGADGSAPRIVEKVKPRVLAEMLSEDWPQAWKDIAQNEEVFAGMARAARGASGVTSGTYLLVEAAMNAAKAQAEGDVEFVKFDGGGRIGVQLRETTAAEIFEGQSGLLRVESLPRRKDVPYRPDVYRRVAIRVGTTETRQPVWAELPVMWHRPLPADADPKWAWILVRRQGPRLVYKLQLTIETRSDLRPRARGTGAVAINIGWRRTDKGLRAGYVVGDDGVEQSIECDPKSVELFEVCERLKSASDQHFNLARAELTEWRASGKPEPEWLALSVQYMAEWQSHVKLSRIAKRWALEVYGSERLEAIWKQWRAHCKRLQKDLLPSRDEAAHWLDWGSPTEAFVLWLELWRRKDEHLWTWSSDERAHAQRRRNQAYRLVAIDLARRYDTLVVDDTDLRPLVDLSEQGLDLPLVARHGRVMAAPYELKRQLVEVFGGRVVKVSNKRNTIEHARCGCAMDADDQSLYLTCEHCGVSVDRDANNCENQLARAGFGPAVAKGAE